ncbi:hypothetical protein M8J75_010287 [Diaphorina citri]|nr:hypothetical protein M8J75_010287 [Diaphorina citri]
MPFISSTDSSAFEGSFPPSGQEIALSTQLVRSEDRWLCKVVSLSREMFSVSRAFDHLNIHKKTHDLRKPHQCSLCNRGYNTVAALTSHLQKHNKNPPDPPTTPPLGASFKCLDCETKFGTPEDLQNHMKEEHNVHPAPLSPSAPHTPPSHPSLMSPLSRSISKLHSSVYQSSPSPLSFPLQFPLASSPSRYSGSPGSIPNARYMCNYCSNGSEGFSSLESLHVHIQTAHGSLLNGDLIREISNRLQHTLSPLSLSPSLSPFPSSPSIPCLFCTLRFSSTDALKIHISTAHARTDLASLRNDLNSSDALKAHISSAQARTDLNALRSDLSSADALKAISSAQNALRSDLSSLYARSNATVSELLSYQQREGKYAQYLTHALNGVTNGEAGTEEGGVKNEGFSPPDQQTKPTDLTVSKKHKLKSAHNNNNNNGPTYDPNKRIKLNGASTNSSELSSVIKHYENAHKLHICSQCDATFPDLASFSLHQKTHLDNDLHRLNNNTTSPELQCKQCSSVFADIRQLSEHFVSHCLAMLKLFQCGACQLSFGSGEELTKHLGETHVCKVYKCGLCSEMYDSKLLIQLHFTQSHHKEVKLYRCTKCPPSPSSGDDTSSFSSHAEFASHVRSAHPLQPSDICTRILPQAPPLLQCIFCFRQFHSASELQLHLHEHTAGPLQCPLCPKTFRVQFLLETHLTTHHPALLSSTDAQGQGGDAKPPALSPSTLKSLHISSPTNQNPLFSSSSNQNALFSSSSNQNALFCDLCDRKDFLSEPELAAHRKLHLSKSTGKVSLSCAYCAENFKSRAELEAHMRTHSVGGTAISTTNVVVPRGGEGGKHKCNICDEIYPTPTGLAEHKLTHCKVVHGTTCTKCKASITSEETFLSHLQQHSTSSNSSSSGGNIILPTSCIICCQTLNTEVETKLHSNFHLKPNPSLLQNAAFSGNPPNSVANFSGTPSSGANFTSSPNTFSNSATSSVANLKGNFGSERSERGFGAHSREDKRSEKELRKMMEMMRGGGGGGGGEKAKAFPCPQCPLSFDMEEEAQTHAQCCHLVTVHECRLCCQIYPDGGALQAHLIEHTFEGLSSYTCFVCLTQFTAVGGLQSHIRCHGPSARSYECVRCPARFFFKAELENHSLGHKEDGGRANYEKMSNYFHYQKSLQQYQQMKEQHQQQNYKSQQRTSSKPTNSESQKPTKTESQQHRPNSESHQHRSNSESQQHSQGRNGVDEHTDKHKEVKRRKHSMDSNENKYGKTVEEMDDRNDKYEASRSRNVDNYAKTVEEMDATRDRNEKHRDKYAEDIEYRDKHTKTTGDMDLTNRNTDKYREYSKMANDMDSPRTRDRDFANNEKEFENSPNDEEINRECREEDEQRNEFDKREAMDSEDERHEQSRSEIGDNRSEIGDNRSEMDDVDMNGDEDFDAKVKRELKSINEDDENMEGGFDEDGGERMDKVGDRCNNNNNGDVKVEIKHEMEDEEDIDVGNNHC